MRELLFSGSLIVAALAMVAACTPATEPPPARQSDAHIARDPSAQPQVAKGPAFLRGYFETRDGGLFTACGETSRRRVQSIDANTLAAITKANAVLDRPRFVVAEGNLVARDAVEIGRFNIIAGDAWACDSRLDEVILGARGSDVLWSLEATSAALTFSSAPGAPPEVHAFAGLQPSPEGLTLNAGNPEFSAALKYDACVEPLTDTTFGWSIAVNASDKHFIGCAWRGLSVAP